MGAVGERVDIVYLWVDGSDPAWRRKRELAYASWVSRNPGELAVYGNVEGRFRDSGELRFSLRALERFFPDHGRVFIVTDGQCPSWLRPGDGLTVIDHSALIPASARPVFDSGHIASYVHLIPGLSERFFLMNDDVFFGAPVELDDWFDPQLTFYVEAATLPSYEKMQAHETALVNASLRAREWMLGRCPDYRHEDHLLAHAPRPLLRSALRELEALAPEEFARVRSTVFRSWRVPSVTSSLLPHWLVHAGRARFEPAPPGHYICTGDAGAEERLRVLRRMLGAMRFFCINDTCDDAASEDRRLLRVREVLQELLPLPSRFEIEDSAQLQALSLIRVRGDRTHA